MCLRPPEEIEFPAELLKDGQELLESDNEWLNNPDEQVCEVQQRVEARTRPARRFEMRCGFVLWWRWAWSE